MQSSAFSMKPHTLLRLCDGLGTADHLVRSLARCPVSPVRAQQRVSRSALFWAHSCASKLAAAPVCYHLSNRRQLSTASGASPARRQLSDLPNKVELLTGPAGRLSKVLKPRKSSQITTRVGSSYGGSHSLQWTSKPNNVLIVKKQNDARALQAMRHVIDHLAQAYPWMNILVEPDAFEELTDSDHAQNLVAVDSTSEADRETLARKADIALTLGGDGSILHVSSLFDQAPVPPVLSFSMGTLGFLLPYNIASFETAFAMLIKGDVSLMLRMRLRQTLHDASGTAICSDGSRCDEVHLMNEIALHRGREPHMTIIDAFVNGQHLTRAISDGLIVATPTGSTAYSLSAGGPIVHPSVQSLLLTPISPRSLSFRTVLLPSDTTIQLKVARTSRSPADLSVDGRHFHTLQQGQYLQVAMSPFPIPCVNFASDADRSRRGTQLGGPDVPQLVEGAAASANPDACESERGEDSWVRDINTLLRFNASFAGRGLLGGNGSYEDSPDDDRG